MHRIEVHQLQRRIETCGVFREMLGDCADRLLQRAKKLVWQFRLDLIAQGLQTVHITPATQYTLDWPLKCCRKYLP